MKRFKRFVSIGMAACLMLLLFFSTGATTALETGMTFVANNPYNTENLTTPLPSTYEATVLFPKSLSGSTRGGIAVGNYKDATTTCVNFEFYQNGSPRLYFIDESGTKYDYKFTNVKLYTGEWAHVAITRDEESDTISCYVNGVLKQTLAYTGPDTFTITRPLRLGDDYRNHNIDAAYIYNLKGTLKNVALYADTRTAAEVSSDYAGTMDTDNLLGYYDLSDLTIGTFPPTIACKAGIGPTFRCSWFNDKEPLDEYAYSFAVIGDTQTLTDRYPDKLPMLYDWILENKEEKKIEFVMGLGDMVETYYPASDPDEWALVKSQIPRMDGVVPYSFVRGNHDNIDSFNEYFSYSEFSDNIDGSYNETMMNTYQKLTIGTHKYLIFSLDITATDAVLAWAGNVIEEHPDHNVIITTHIYLSTNGKPLTSLKYSAVNTGQDLWDEFISQHENIVLVLCGHCPYDNIVKAETKGVNGNTVTQLLVDPQTTDKNWSGGTGLIAMLYFSKDGATVQVEYYSVIKDAYFLAENQFTMQLDVVDDNAGETMLGDVNGDAKVNNKDLGLLLQHLNGWDIDVIESACDVTDDGKINNKDLGILLQYLNGWDVQLGSPEKINQSEPTVKDNNENLSA